MQLNFVHQQIGTRPEEIAQFLDSLTFFRLKSAAILSAIAAGASQPKISCAVSLLEHGLAVCEEGAFAALYCMDQTLNPHYLWMRNVHNAGNHCVCAYQKDGKYGSVGFAGSLPLNHREPTHDTINSLVDSYKGLHPQFEPGSHITIPLPCVVDTIGPDFGLEDFNWSLAGAKRKGP